MWGSTFPSNASVDGMADAERRSYEGLSQLIVLGQDDGSVRTDVDAMASAVLLHGLMRGVAACSLATEARRTCTVRRTCHEWISSALVPA